MTVDLSVVVTTHNRAALVDETLRSLAAQTWPDGTWDVVVVDNDSSDDTPAVLQRWQSELSVPLRVVRAVDEHGPSYARNIGVDHTEANSVAFVDDDDCVAPGWVASIGEALRDNTLVGSRYEYLQLNSGALADSQTLQTNGLANAYGIRTVSGGGMACRRTLWTELGGSDESLRFGEDIDFSIRVTRDLKVEPTFCEGAIYHVRLREGARTAWKRGLQLGRASVNLHSRHGAALGVRPDRAGLLVRVWAGYVLRLPSLIRRDTRLLYVEQLARRVGRLRGSVLERTWYP